ncbi:MAG: hypothetical protein WBD71_08095, partial [Xanthobacteraceae bacterium]
MIQAADGCRHQLIGRHFEAALQLPGMGGRQQREHGHRSNYRIPGQYPISKGPHGHRGRMVGKKGLSI